jgi:hypothetical protein
MVTRVTLLCCAYCPRRNPSIERDSLPAAPRFRRQASLMKLFLIRFMTLALMAAAGATSAQELGGLWSLSIRNLSHKEIATLSVRFTSTPGRSCIGGEWKQVKVESASTSDLKFFPVHDELTYLVEDSQLVIGRNGVCDGYLRLSGRLDAKLIQGAYYAFGLRGGSDLGEFQLSPAP